MVLDADRLDFNPHSFQRDHCISSAWRLNQQNAPNVECRRRCVALDAVEHRIVTLVILWQFSTVVATVKQWTSLVINPIIAL